MRKRLFNVTETTGLPDAAYQTATSQRIYETLARTAQRVLAQGCSVVLDAAFMQESQRAGLSDLARKHDAGFVGLFLTADIATRLARIEQRTRRVGRNTDVALQQEATAPGIVNWHRVDASGTPEDTRRQSIACLSHLIARRATHEALDPRRLDVRQPSPRAHRLCSANAERRELAAFASLGE